MIKLGGTELIVHALTVHPMRVCKYQVMHDGTLHVHRIAFLNRTIYVHLHVRWSLHEFTLVHIHGLTRDHSEIRTQRT